MLVGTGAGAAADLLPPGGEDLVDMLLRNVVGSQLRVGEDRLEVADQVGGADDLLA